MIFTEWKRDDESTAAIDFTFNSHVSAVQLYQFLDQRQANSRSFVTAAARAFHAVKTFENVRQCFRRYAGARVSYGEFNHLTNLLEFGNSFAAQRELESV